MIFLKRLSIKGNYYSGSRGASGIFFNFTHIGLVPQAECYQNCVKGWDRYFNGSLLNLLTTGKGQPN